MSDILLGLVSETRTEILTGVLVSTNKVKLYNGNTVVFQGRVGISDIGKSAKFIKEKGQYTLLDFSRKTNTKSKTFIV